MICHCLDFKVGDRAIYGGGNVDYVGTITAIGAKTVTIVAYAGTGCERVSRLSLWDFDRLNWDFNAEETERRNAAWMD